MHPGPNLTFLGAAAAFTTTFGRFQSNLVLRGVSGRRMLIDCGGDIRWSMKAQGLAPRDIDAVYVSHLHADHIGGLEYLALSTRFDPSCARPTLYISQTIEDALWRSLAGGLETVNDRKATLSYYFDVLSFEPTGTFEWEGIGFRLVPFVHVPSPSGPLISHGLVIKGPQQRVLLSTDVTFSPEILLVEAEGVDLFLHDCEISSMKTGVHPRYEDLVSLPGPIKRKMMLYGYQDGELPDAVADGFIGYAQTGTNITL